jgi:hypothetical protein
MVVPQSPAAGFKSTAFEVAFIVGWSLVSGLLFSNTHTLIALLIAIVMLIEDGRAVNSIYSGSREWVCRIFKGSGAK